MPNPYTLLLGLLATPPPPGYGFMEEEVVVPEVEQVQGGGVVEEQAEGGAQWFTSITFSQFGLICSHLMVKKLKILFGCSKTEK